MPALHFSNIRVNRPHPCWTFISLYFSLELFGNEPRDSRGGFLITGCGQLVAQASRLCRRRLQKIEF